jgi:hypothetical protein
VAVSGTVSQTTFNTRKVIDHAFRRCRMPPEGVGSELLSVAQDTLYLLLSKLANRGLQLWCIEKDILPLYTNTAEVPVPVGTVDLLNTFLRTMEYPGGAGVQTSTSYTWTLTTAGTITTVGVNWNGTSCQFAVDYSTDGVNWEEILSVANPNLTSGATTWADIDGAPTAQYWRVRAINDNLNIDIALFGNTPNEIPMARLNRDSYTNLPNKTFQGRPLQFWLDRTLNQPVMYIWPVPAPEYEGSQVVTWVKRYIMDVGSLTQEIEVPQRWFDAIVAMLAAELAIQLPTVDPAFIAILDQKAMRTLNEAEMEERDNSPIYFTPNIAVYTR